MSNEPTNRLLKIFHVSIAVIAAISFNLLRGFCVMRFKDGCTRKVNTRIGRLFFAMAEVIDFNSESKVIDNDQALFIILDIAELLNMMRNKLRS
ncbi:hypothetical protein NA76_20530 [Vibrio vulnificus]|nr:hypothetical protein NA76_20530 [Vibrio vulnificus]